MVPESFNIPNTAWKKEDISGRESLSYSLFCPLKVSSLVMRRIHLGAGTDVRHISIQWLSLSATPPPPVSSLTLCGSTALMELRCFSLTLFVKVTVELFTSCDGFSNVSLSHNNQPAERGNQDLEVAKRHQDGHQARSRRLQTDTQISKIIFFNCGFYDSSPW